MVSSNHILWYSSDGRRPDLSVRLGREGTNERTAFNLRRLIRPVQLVIIIFLNIMSSSHDALAIRGRCLIRCGVISEQRGATTLQSFVSTVWDDLHYTKSLTNVDVQFVRIERRDDMTMESLVEAYMEIGTTNISALIGPYRQALATVTQKFAIPYFTTDDPSELIQRYSHFNLISVQPSLTDVYRIAVDLLVHFNWTSAAVLYESDDGVRLIEEFVRQPSVWVRAWRLESSGSSASGDDMEEGGEEEREEGDERGGTVTIRRALLQVRQLGMTNVVVLASRPVTEKVLDTAIRLSMLARKYSWLLLSMNLDETTLRRYAYAQARVTSLHIVKTHLPDTEYAAERYSKPEYAAVYDSLLALYHAVKIHYRNNSNCLWTGRDSIQVALTKIEETGATGALTFRADGARHGYTVEVLGLQPSGLIQMGSWNSSAADAGSRLVMTGTSLFDISKQQLGRGKRIKIAVILERPYVMLRSEEENGEQEYAERKPMPSGRSGGRAPGLGTVTEMRPYVGYHIDILDSIAASIGFSYDIYPVSSFPSALPSSSSSSSSFSNVDDDLDIAFTDSPSTQPPLTQEQRVALLAAALSSENATLALLPFRSTLFLSSSSAYKDVMDFSNAIDSVVSLSVLIKHPNAKKDAGAIGILFQFLRPLTPTVWVLLALVFVAVTVVRYVLVRLTEGGRSRKGIEGALLNYHPTDVSLYEDEVHTTDIGAKRNGLRPAVGGTLTMCGPAEIDREIPRGVASRPTTVSDCAWHTFSSMILMSHPPSAVAGVGNGATGSSTTIQQPWRCGSGAARVPPVRCVQLLTGSLWLFSLVIVASYASNMAAMLTIARFMEDEHAQSDAILRRQTANTRLVTLIGSDVSALLDELGRQPSSGHGDNQDLWRLWQYSRSGLRQDPPRNRNSDGGGESDSVVHLTSTVNSVAEGLRCACLDSKGHGATDDLHASVEKWAFVHHTMIVRYEVKSMSRRRRLGGNAMTSPCNEDDADLLDIAIPLYGIEGGHVIGVQKGFAGQMAQINAAIDRLSRDGTLLALRNKRSSAEATSRDVTGLTAHDVGGLFLLLLVSVLLSIVLGVIEYTYRSVAGRNRFSHKGSPPKRYENHSGSAGITSSGILRRRQRSLLSGGDREEPPWTAATTAAAAAAAAETAAKAASATGSTTSFSQPNVVQSSTISRMTSGRDASERGGVMTSSSFTMSSEPSCSHSMTLLRNSTAALAHETIF